MNKQQYTTTKRQEETDFIEASPLDNVSADKALKMVEAQQVKRERLLAQAMEFCS